MKRHHLNSIARSQVEMLFSRNNDINGYWGIGVLCLLAKSKSINRMSFKIYPGKRIKIYGCEVSDSENCTEKLLKLGIDSIEGRISFFSDGRFDNGKDRYTCGMAVSVTHSGRTGLYMSYIECWPHDPAVERRRVKYYVKEDRIIDGTVTKVVKWISKIWK